jgi:hypothetical protein
MTKTETAILESKTPEEYIDRSLRARISPAAKAKLARHWMESTGYTKEDILRARNRHPYWKRKKMEGSAERTRKRLAAHDYSEGSSVQWDAALVADFLGLNQRGPDGRYENKDWQLAERFGATIPSIQYMRRKLSKVEELLGARASHGKVVEYLLRAESVLSRGKAAVEELKAARTSRAASSGGKAAKRGASAKSGSKAQAKPAAKAKGAKSAKSPSAAKKPKVAKRTPPKLAAKAAPPKKAVKKANSKK